MFLDTLQMSHSFTRKGVESSIMFYLVYCQILFFKYLSGLLSCKTPSGNEPNLGITSTKQ